MEKGTVKDNVPRGDPRNVLHEKMLEEIIEGKLQKAIIKF